MAHLGCAQRGYKLQRILIRIVINAVALWVAAGLVGGITLEGGLWQLLLAAAVFGIVNAFLKPLFIILSLPALLLSLGLALVVINAAILSIADALTGAITVDDFFWSAILGAIVISMVSWVAGRLFSDNKEESWA